MGFQILPGSSVLNGIRIADPTTYADGLPEGTLSGAIEASTNRNIALWETGRLEGGGELELTYVAVVGLNASRGVARNRAEAVGLDEGGGCSR